MIVVDKANTEPTDRSIPPDKMTNVMPTARMAATATDSWRDAAGSSTPPRWTAKPAEREAVYANRRRLRGERGRKLLRKRGELIERSFAHG